MSATPLTAVGDAQLSTPRQRLALRHHRRRRRLLGVLPRSVVASSSVSSSAANNNCFLLIARRDVRSTRRFKSFAAVFFSATRAAHSLNGDASVRQRGSLRARASVEDAPVRGNLRERADVRLGQRSSPAVVAYSDVGRSVTASASLEERRDQHFAARRRGGSGGGLRRRRR